MPSPAEHIPDAELSSKTIAGLREDGLTPNRINPHKVNPGGDRICTTDHYFCDVPEEYHQKAIVEQWHDIPPVSEDYETSRDAIVEHIRNYQSFMNIQSAKDIQIPPQSYADIFLRFLKFGFLAWGGPFAQIAMIRQELVEEEKWISPEKFNRVLSVYQALPGPEAHELCVYFGMIAGGRVGALLAGLGFMLPGFVLMLALSWFYVSYGINSPLFQSVFSGMQPAVAALIVRAVHRIGSHALHENRWLWGIAFLGALAQLLKVNFLITLLLAGLVFALAQRKQNVLAFILATGFLIWLALIGFAGIQQLRIYRALPVPRHNPLRS